MIKARTACQKVSLVSPMVNNQPMNQMGPIKLALPPTFFPLSLVSSVISSLLYYEVESEKITFIIIMEVEFIWYLFFRN